MSLTVILWIPSNVRNAAFTRDGNVSFQYLQRRERSFLDPGEGYLDASMEGPNPRPRQNNRVDLERDLPQYFRITFGYRDLMQFDYRLPGHGSFKPVGIFQGVERIYLMVVVKAIMGWP